MTSGRQSRSRSGSRERIRSPLDKTGKGGQLDVVAAAMFDRARVRGSRFDHVSIRGVISPFLSVIIRSFTSLSALESTQWHPSGSSTRYSRMA